MSRKVKRQVAMLPEYDQHMYLGVINKTDELKENLLIRSRLQVGLGIKVPYQLETGERVQRDVIDVIVSETLKDAMINPTTSKLKDLCAMNGEMKENINLNLQTASDLFGDIANK